MRIAHFIFLAPLLFACLILLSCPTGNTNSNNPLVCECENGCCDNDGNCHAQPNKNYCGPPGEKCKACTNQGYTCTTDGECVEETPNPSDTCTNCAGCCDALGQCITNLNDAACGSGGNQCGNCSIKGMTCNLAIQACVSNDPCNNRCAGEPLDNGAVCLSNRCNGCCRTVIENSKEVIRCLTIEQQSAQACGSGGQTCGICNSNIPCTNGACSSTCSPNCNGRCNGISDGCGGQCPQNCTVGCCSNSGWCSTTDDPSACGSTGTCKVCDNEKPLCSNGECIAGTCKTTCTGCCDRYTGECITPGTSPEACGLNGDECKQCQDQCQEGSCYSPSQATYQIKVTNIHTNPQSTVRFYWKTDLEKDYPHYIDIPPGKTMITTNKFATTAGSRTISSYLIDLATIGQMCEKDPGFSGDFAPKTANIPLGENYIFEYTTLADAKYNVAISNKTQSIIYIYFHASRHPSDFSCPAPGTCPSNHECWLPTPTTYYSAWAEPNTFSVAWSTSANGPWTYKKEDFTLATSEVKTIKMNIP